MGSVSELTLLAGATGWMRPAPHGYSLRFSLSSVAGASIEGGRHGGGGVSVGLVQNVVHE